MLLLLSVRNSVLATLNPKTKHNFVLTVSAIHSLPYQEQPVCDSSKNKNPKKNVEKKCGTTNKIADKIP